MRIFHFDKKGRFFLKRKQSSLLLTTPEDDETLAEIDEGIADAAAGRTLRSEEVRKLFPKWISDSRCKKPEA